ncbi:hypothetical protein PT974_00229 [Cladobotryum mycophilum]|uniref:Uncharacterized protein n=1 Tax=Cladobotryum mycophilum TaxID=491253 RepID=A0ABR0T1H2_9HYPO
MALGNQQLTIGAGPATEKSTRSLFLSLYSDLSDAIGLGHNRNSDSISTSTRFYPERACGDTLSSSILVGSCHINATTPKRRHTTSAYIYHPRDVLDDSPKWPATSPRFTARPGARTTAPSLGLPRMHVSQGSNFTRPMEQGLRGLIPSPGIPEISQDQLVARFSPMCAPLVKARSNRTKLNIAQMTQNEIPLRPNNY